MEIGIEKYIETRFSIWESNLDTMVNGKGTHSPLLHMGGLQTPQIGENVLHVYMRHCTTF